MKITICGSINHSDKIIEARNKLIKMGFDIHIPYMTERILNKEISLEEFISKKLKNGDKEFRESASEDLIKRYYNFIKDSDAILVINEDKNGIKNYIGGNSFLEMGFAHVLNKKIYLTNDIPEMIYKDEIIAMGPVVINGDLSKISSHHGT